MKSFYLIVFALFLAPYTNAQDTTADNNLHTQLVGTWEHMSSTFPSGIITKYRREFQLYKDGTGTCVHFAEIDTLYTPLAWEVKDSVVFLYLVDKKGNKELTDSQMISLLDAESLKMNRVQGDPDLRKEAYYRKKEGLAEVAKY